MCFFNFCIMFQGKNMLLFAEHLILYQEGQEKELPMSKVGHLSFTETQDHRLVTDVSTSDTTCDKKNLVVQWYIFLVAQTDPVAHFYRKIIFCYNKVIGIIFFSLALFCLCANHLLSHFYWKYSSCQVWTRCQAQICEFEGFHYLCQHSANLSW